MSMFALSLAEGSILHLSQYGKSFLKHIWYRQYSNIPITLKLHTDYGSQYSYYVQNFKTIKPKSSL